MEGWKGEGRTSHLSFLELVQALLAQLLFSEILAADVTPSVSNKMGQTHFNKAHNVKYTLYMYIPPSCLGGYYSDCSNV